MKMKMKMKMEIKLEMEMDGTAETALDSRRLMGLTKVAAAHSEGE